MSEAIPFLSREDVSPTGMALTRKQAFDFYNQWMKRSGLWDEGEHHLAVEDYEHSIAAFETELRENVASTRDKLEKSKREESSFRAAHPDLVGIRLSDNSEDFDAWEREDDYYFIIDRLEQAQFDYDQALTNLASFLQDATDFLVEHINSEIEILTYNPTEEDGQCSHNDSRTQLTTDRSSRDPQTPAGYIAENRGKADIGTEKTLRDDLPGCLSAWGAMILFGFVLSYLSKNYHEALFTGIGVFMVGGFVYALVKHTARTIMIIGLLVAAMIFSEVFRFCADQSSFQPYEGPTKYHP